MLTLATFTLFLAALQQEDPQASFVPATVVEGGAVVRSFHHVDMPILVELSAGSLVKVVAKREPWARVLVPGGFTVWVWADYLDVEGDGGVINASHVRARPMPSTSAQSYPVGQFSKGDEVLVVGSEENWLQVRAPETLGAWIELKYLNTMEEVPSEWEAQWVAAQPQFEDAVEEMVVVSTGPAGEDAIDAEQVPGETTAADKMGPVAPVPVDLTVEALIAAEASLTDLAGDNWSNEAAAQLEAVFGAVMWTSSDVDLVKRARLGLERLDAITLQTAQMTATPATVDFSTEVKAAPASTARTLAFPQPEYALVGLLEYTPAVYSAVPYSISTGDQIDSVMSRDGRFDLHDFLGKEVAVRGIWRKSAMRHHRVLEIVSIRIVPPAEPEPVPQEPEKPNVEAAPAIE